jgi:hypothetical protein
MLKRRSSKGMVIAWNMMAVVINFLSGAAYLRFADGERNPAPRPTS